MMNNDTLMLNTDQRQFMMLYHDCIDSKMLSNPNQLSVFVILKRFANQMGVCFPGLDTIADLSGISKTTVQRTLKELAKKGIIAIRKRKRVDGGCASNEYVVNDIHSLWVQNNPKPEIKEETEEEKKYKSAKENKIMNIFKKNTKKEFSSADQSKKENSKSSMHASTLSVTNNTVKTQKSQHKERISIEELKAKFDYNIMSNDENTDKNDIDAAISILHRNINSNKATVKMGENYIPGAQFREKLMQLTNESILYAIKKFRERKGIIKNPEGYLLSILYRANEQYRLYVENHMRTLFGY